MAAQDDIYKNNPYAPPQVDYNALAQPEVSLYDEILNRYRTKVDPAVQAEQDKKIAQGRAFWAGANMLGNVISNMMNVNAVKAGAPSAQTYNGEAFNQMYNLWKDADTRLMAERRAAQERYDAAALAQARLKSAAAEKDAAQRLNQYNMQFNLDNREREYQRGRADHASDVDEQRRWQEKKDAESHKFQKELAEASQRHQEKMLNDRQTHADEAAKDGLNITFYDNSGHAYDIPAQTKNERIANESKLTSLVNTFVREYPDLFKRTLRSTDKGYVDPSDKLNYREGINDVQITPESIKDPVSFIEQHDLMNNAMFVNRFVDLFGEQYAPYQRHDITKMPIKGQQNNFGSFFK